MTVLYFSSTGNGIYIARSFGGKTVSIAQAVKNNQYSFKDECIGIIFPVYGLCIPPYVADFIKESKFECEYLFGVASYGFYAGATADRLSKLNSRKFDFIELVKLAENYIPEFDMEKEIKKYPPADIEKKVSEIVKRVEKREKFIHKSTALDRFMTYTHEKKYAYNIGEGVSSGYHLASSCKGCGFCADVCPTGNIEIKNGTPVFANKCMSCLACAHNCPANAIFVKGEKNHTKYRNPFVSANDIAMANNQKTKTVTTW